MELHAFVTCDELIAVLNGIAEETACRIFVAEESNLPYKAMAHVQLADIVRARNIELGFLAEGVRLMSKPVKDIYREDRDGFVSAHAGCKSKNDGVLLETTFAADSSNSTKIIFKALRKVMGRIAKKGVRAINDSSAGTNTSKSIYWTDGALKTGKIWKQTENSYVRFEPL